MDGIHLQEDFYSTRTGFSGQCCCKLDKTQQELTKNAPYSMLESNYAWLILIVSLFIAESESTCYLPNGTTVPGWSSASVYQPCSQDSTNPLSSICCATNRNNPSGGSIKNGKHLLSSTPSLPYLQTPHFVFIIRLWRSFLMTS